MRTGILTFATLKEIGWAKDQTANALVSTIEGRDVALKNLPALALRGRDVGDQLPIYALPNKPERVVWAGEIDAPADHVLPAQATDDSSLAARDAQERYDMQVKQAAAEEWLSDFTAKATDAEAVNDAISRSTDPRGSGIDASSAGAIHTKFVRLTFFDFFVIPFFVVHGGIFLTVGLGSFGGGGAPFFPNRWYLRFGRIDRDGLRRLHGFTVDPQVTSTRPTGVGWRAQDGFVLGVKRHAGPRQ